MNRQAQKFYSAKLALEYARKLEKLNPFGEYALITRRAIARRMRHACA